jgi:hypothetical protein
MYKKILREKINEQNAHDDGRNDGRKQQWRNVQE